MNTPPKLFVVLVDALVQKGVLLEPMEVSAERQNDTSAAGKWLVTFKDKRSYETVEAPVQYAVFSTVANDPEEIQAHLELHGVFQSFTPSDEGYWFIDDNIDEINKLMGIVWYVRA